MTEGPTFSTRGEMIESIHAALDAVGRLPVAGFDTGGILSALDRALAAAESVPLCPPALAIGTHRWREVHGLQPIKEN